MQHVYIYIAKWNKNSDAFAKLQAAYGVLAGILFLGAAFISLVNANLGQAIVFYSFIALLTFIANGVMWALLKTFIMPAIERRAPKVTSRKK